MSDWRPYEQCLENEEAAIARRTIHCICPPPCKVVAIGPYFAPGVTVVVQRDPDCPIHGDRGLLR